MARTLLMPLAFAPHSGKLAKEAADLIAEIDGKFPDARPAGD
jgi:hypothetical protein